MKRLLLIGLVFLVSFGILAMLGAIAVLILAGPHSDLLPNYLQIIVLNLIWIIVLGIPIWLSYLVYRRLGDKK